MKQKHRFMEQIIFLSLCLFFLVPSCTKRSDNHLLLNSTLLPEAIPHTPTNPSKLSTTPALSTPTISISETSQNPIDPLACKQPSEDYAILVINGHQLNQRTYDMLITAKSLYGGVIDITSNAITQGSYTDHVDSSFGTHAGGGAVDLSVMAPETYTIMVEDIAPLIQSLRLAGFAAWFRDLDELFDGSPAHIHAIAIGDRTLSLAAREQLAGPFGYFWGYNGLLIKDKTPIRDSHGGPIVCDWMIDKGYPNKTATPAADEIAP